MYTETLPHLKYLISPWNPQHLSGTSKSGHYCMSSGTIDRVALRGILPHCHCVCVCVVCEHINGVNKLALILTFSASANS